MPDFLGAIMKKYLIIYFLSLPPKKYKGFFLALEALDGHAKLTENAYIVSTDLSVEEMRLYLIPYLERADRLIIAQQQGEFAARNAIQESRLKDILV